MLHGRSRDTVMRTFAAGGPVNHRTERQRGADPQAYYWRLVAQVMERFLATAPVRALSGTLTEAYSVGQRLKRGSKRKIEYGYIVHVAAGEGCERVTVGRGEPVLVVVYSRIPVKT